MATLARPVDYLIGSGNRQRIRPGSLRARSRGEGPPEPDDVDDSYAADRVLFGSDFPHPEGMSAEEDYQDRVAELVAKVDRPDDEVRLVLRDNLLRVLGLDGTT